MIYLIIIYIVEYRFIGRISQDMELHLDSTDYCPMDACITRPSPKHLSSNSFWPSANQIFLELLKTSNQPFSSSSIPFPIMNQSKPKY